MSPGAGKGLTAARICLERIAPRLGAAGVYMNLTTAVLLAALLFAPAGSAKEKCRKGLDEIGNDDPGRGLNFYSLEQEIALGRQMAGEVELNARLLDDQMVGEYVNRVGQNLARNSAAKVPFTIKVIDSEEVNAFALPGGFMFVNAGVILEASREAELAGVLAHEIAHVAARHASKQATRGEIASYASIPLIFLGGWAGFAIREAAGLAVPMSFLQFSRGMEAQADRLGTEYMYKAGYDPAALVDFFEKIETLERRKPSAIARMFSTHPMTKDRIRNVQKEIQDGLQPRPQYVLDTSEFHDVQSRLEALEKRRKGAHPADFPTLRRRTDSEGEDGRPAASADGAPTLKRQD
jgi:predicted Zn-dependent protease